jgi:cell division control protein 6
MPRITRKKSSVDLEMKENIKIKLTRRSKRKNDESFSSEDEISPEKSSRSESSLSPIVEQINKVKISQEQNQFRSARRALVQNQNHSLPGREKEWNELIEYLEDHIQAEKSGSLYLSGAPGTGKNNYLSNPSQISYNLFF